MRSLRYYVLTLLVFCAACGTETPVEHSGQTGSKSDTTAIPDTTSISGTAAAVSCDAELLEGIAVSIDGTNRKTVTDANGNWKIANLPHGSYNLTFTREGYFTDHCLDIQVRPDIPHATPYQEILLTEIRRDSAVLTEVTFHPDSMWVGTITYTERDCQTPEKCERYGCCTCPLKITGREERYHRTDSGTVIVKGKLLSDKWSFVKQVYVQAPSNIGVICGNETKDDYITSADVADDGTFSFRLHLMHHIMNLPGTEVEISVKPLTCSETTWWDPVTKTSPSASNRNPATTFRLTIPTNHYYD